MGLHLADLPSAKYEVVIHKHDICLNLYGIQTLPQICLRFSLSYKWETYGIGQKLKLSSIPLQLT